MPSISIPDWIGPTPCFVLNAGFTGTETGSCIATDQNARPALAALPPELGLSVNKLPAPTGWCSPLRFTVPPDHCLQRPPQTVGNLPAMINAYRAFQSSKMRSARHLAETDMSGEHCSELSRHGQIIWRGVESRLSPVQPAVPQLDQPTSGTTLAALELLLRPAQDGDVNSRMELDFEGVATGNLAYVQRYTKAAAVTSVQGYASAQYRPKNKNYATRTKSIVRFSAKNLAQADQPLSR